ncbi:lipid II flippase MurJ [Pedobacter sp. JY14-1]|uniref:lipid II flippase MurJ n=1 Tax=Pedobacter sp. JY14-1 TaxID=3034151 RepID=UPI0023E17204|nr:lipid II flippase MurJ [Pedobacter sp. JY14-1]
MRKSATLIFILRVIRLVVAVVNLSLAARYFGVNFERDVWLLALTCVIVIDTVLWGAINDTFRAKFIFLKSEEGEAAATERANSLLLFTHLVSIALVIAVVLFPKIIAQVIAPAYKDAQLTSLVLMIRIVAPSFLLTQIVKLLASILNAYGSFIIPEVLGFFTQLFTLVIVVLFADAIGIYTLAISYYVGLILLLILLLYQLKRRGVKLHLKLSSVRLQNFRPFLLFSFPFFFIYLSSQLNIVIERGLASSVAVGSVSVLDYSRKFSDIPLEVLVGIITSLLIPVLTRSYSKHDHRLFIEEFRKIYQFGLLVLIFIAGMFTACPEAIVRLLYQKGEMSQSILQDISRLTMYYSWSAVAVFMYQIFGSALISAQNGLRFAFLGTFAQLIMIVINLGLYDRFSFYLFPFSLFISHALVALIMALQFPVPARRLLPISVSYISVMIISCAIAWSLNYFLFTGFHIVLRIVLTALVLVLVTGGAIFSFKLEERTVILNLLKRALPEK